MCSDTKSLKFLVEKESLGKRLDSFLFEKMPDLSRSYVKKCVQASTVKVNGVPHKPAYKLKAGENVTFESLPIVVPKPHAKKILIEVIYETKDYILINKPAGLLVHSALTTYDEPTLVDAVLHHCSEALSKGSGALRPGIVHRLDKNTSGCILVAKNDKAHRFLADQFKTRKVKKTYLALVKGKLEPNSGTVESPVGRSYKDRKKMSVFTMKGRKAVSHYKVLEYLPGLSFLEVKIETGRTHQIRVHMASIGHPIIMDSTYGDRKLNNEFSKKYKLERQFLHAQKLGFYGLDGKFLEFEAKLPPDLEKVLALF